MTCRPRGRLLVHYLGHSAWLVRTPRRYLLFDYGDLPVRPQNTGLAQGTLDLSELEPLPLYAIASHSHPDHYSAELFKKLNLRPDAFCFLGLDQKPLGGRKRALAQVCPVWPDYRLQLNDLRLSFSGSTDSGVSVLVETPEAVIYHGGDLAVWDDTPLYRQVYRQEIDRLAAWLEAAGRPLDLAFLPVSTSDGYQEDALLQGLWYALKHLRPQTAMPMHADRFEMLYRRFASLAQKTGQAGQTSVVAPEKPGDCFIRVETGAAGTPGGFNPPIEGGC